MLLKNFQVAYADKSTPSPTSKSFEPTNRGLISHTSSGNTISAMTILINITITSNKPISARNFSSDRKYHGRMLTSTMLAVKKIALPVVPTAAVIAFS